MRCWVGLMVRMKNSASSSVDSRMAADQTAGSWVESWADQTAGGWVSCLVNWLESMMADTMAQEMIYWAVLLVHQVLHRSGSSWSSCSSNSWCLRMKVTPSFCCCCSSDICSIWHTWSSLSTLASLQWAPTSRHRSWMTWKTPTFRGSQMTPKSSRFLWYTTVEFRE